MTTSDLIDLEESHLLRTYNKLPIVLERGEGARVWDVEGNEYLDFYGGHCVALLGHSPPAVVGAVKQQAEKLLFYSNVAYSPIRAEAAAKVIELAQEHLSSVFFANSGSEANETALKLARKFTCKSGVIATEAGFHGRTLGSLAVTGNQSYRKPYASVLPESHFVPFGDADAVASILDADDDIAAVILEPIQSIAGMQSAPVTYYESLRTLCDEHGVVLIFDEVQTGVGRTGAFTYAQKIGVKPDLVTLAKSLGAGVPVSAVLVSGEIAETVEHGDQGSTFGGGMLAMAAVKATLETLRQEQLMQRADEIFGQIQEGLSGHVEAVRGAGCLIGVELSGQAEPAGAADATDAKSVVGALRERGILTGTSADPRTLRLMPPLVVSDDDVAGFIDTFKQVLTASATPVT